MRAIDAQNKAAAGAAAAPARQEYSSKCEQNGSNFSFVHSDSQNRLTTSRMQAGVAVQQPALG